MSRHRAAARPGWVRRCWRRLPEWAVVPVFAAAHVAAFGGLPWLALWLEGR